MRDGADDTHAQRHGAERIFGAGIGRNTYQIHRDSYSAICTGRSDVTFSAAHDP